MLGVADKNASEGMYEILREVMKRADIGINGPFFSLSKHYDCSGTSMVSLSLFFWQQQLIILLLFFFFAFSLSPLFLSLSVGYAIVYECVRTVTSIYPDPSLIEDASSSISRFITSDNHNLKYLGVNALAAIVQIDSKYAAEHQLVVIDCLEDPDETLKRKTLDLLYSMSVSLSLRRCCLACVAAFFGSHTALSALSCCFFLFVCFVLFSGRILKT